MKAVGTFLRQNGLYTMIAQQLDPHQPAALHHRGAAGRGLRGHRPGARDRRRGRHRVTSVRRGQRRSRRGCLPRRAAGRGGTPRCARRSSSVGVLLLVAVAWEAAKWIAGDPWRIAIGGFTYTHTPPLRVADRERHLPAAPVDDRRDTLRSGPGRPAALAVPDRRRVLHAAHRVRGVRGRGAARAWASGSSSSTPASSSARSCPGWSGARPSRSSRSRRSWSWHSARAGSRWRWLPRT